MITHIGPLSRAVNGKVSEGDDGQAVDFAERAAELLATNKNPTREAIVAHMDGNICRCGTYPRIVRAIQRAAKEA